MRGREAFDPGFGASAGTGERRSDRTSTIRIVFYLFGSIAGFRPLCVPKIRFCNIDGEGRQGQVVRRRRRGAQSRAGEGRPCLEIDGSSIHYNRRHIRVGSGAGALRQTRFRLRKPIDFRNEVRSEPRYTRLRMQIRKQHVLRSITSRVCLWIDPPA